MSDKKKVKYAILNLLSQLDPEKDIFAYGDGICYQDIVLHLLNKYAEYTDVDWTDVKKDTPIYIIAFPQGLIPAYFSYYDKNNNYVWVYKNGATSFSAINSTKVHDNILLKEEFDKILEKVPTLKMNTDS